MTKNKWLTHFGLTESPFSKQIADDQLWLPSSRKAIVDDLVGAMYDHHHVLLVGEPGVGKTCILRALRRRLPDTGFRLTYCHNATLGRRDFYRQLCLALGLSPKATAAAVFFAVSSNVEELARSRVHPVFLLDEAHLLHQDVLEHLHVLTNYEWDSAPLLSLVLVGLPEMGDRLQLRKNRSLYSRIHTRITLADALPEDTNEYIAYRMKRAGCGRDVFSTGALAMLHEATAGRLRAIDRIATSTLMTAARKKLRTVDTDLVEQALDADRLEVAV